MIEQVAEFVGNHTLLCAGFSAVLVVWIYTEISQKTRRFKEVGAQQAVHLINREGAVVLDLRPETEFRAGHITSAKNFSLESIETRAHELDRLKDQPIIVYANNPQTTISACEKLVGRGFPRVLSLAGGYQGWLGENFPVERIGKR